MFRHFTCPGCSRAFIFAKSDEGKSLQCTYCDKVSKTEVTPLGVDTVVGHHYLLKQLIEQRDLGHTYMAQNLKDDSACQVMLFVSDFSDHITDINEFRYFITAASKICAPAHVQITDSGVDEEICFIVWDHPDTEPLQHVVERAGGLPPVQAATACREIALSLSNAWRVSSFPHLNISPDCIYVDGDGKIYLHDFGITYFLFQDNKFLEADFPLLSPKFVSPALAMGQENVDYHSDIYSLGAVFYFMMLGHPPFPNTEDPAEIMRSPLLLSESEMLKTGPATAALVKRMLSKTPEDEFADWAQVLDAFDEAIGQVRDQRAKSSGDTSTSRVRAVLPGDLGLEFAPDGKPKFSVKSSGEKVVLPPRSPRSTGRFSIEDSIEKLSAYPKQKVAPSTAQKLYKTQPRSPARQTAFRRQMTKTDMSMVAMERQVTHTQALQRAKAGQRSTAALVWAVLVLIAVVMGLVAALVLRKNPSVTGEAAVGDPADLKGVRQIRLGVTPARPDEPETAAAPARPGVGPAAGNGMEVESGEEPAKAGGTTPKERESAGPSLGAMWKQAEGMGEVNQENYELVVAAFRDVAKQAARAGNTELRMRAMERIAELEAKKAMSVAEGKRNFELRVARLVEEGKFDEALALCDNSKQAWATEYGHERLVWRKKITEKTGDTAGAAKAAPIQGQVAEVERLVAEALAGTRVVEARELLIKVADEEEKVHGEAYTNFVDLLETCTPEALSESVREGLKASIGKDSEYELANGSLVGLRIVARKGDDLQVIQHAGDAEVKKTIPVSELSVRQRMKYIRADEPAAQALRQALYAQQESAYDDAGKALEGYTGFLGGDLKEQFPKAAREGRETRAKRLLDESVRAMGLDPETSPTELISRISKTTVTPAQAEVITKNLTVLAQDLPNTEVYTRNRILIAAFQVHVARFIPRPDAEVAADDAKAKAEKKAPRLATVGVEGGAPLLEDAVKRLKPGQTLRLEPATYSEKMKIMTPEITIDGTRGVVLKEEIVVYKEKVTLKNLFLKGSSVRIVSGVNGVTIENCVIDGGTVEFGGKHEGVTIVNSRMHGLVLREVSGLTMNHCTVLASSGKGRDHRLEENEASAIAGDFDGKILNSIIYSEDGVAMALDGIRRKRLTFSANLIYGKVAMALLRTPKGLVSVTNLKEFEREIGRGAQFVTSEPQFADPAQGNYKLSITSPGAKACKDGLDMGMLTDDDNWPVYINDARRAE